ncbi:class A beta-lactamase-related serine hydrolase [Flavobacterium sp. GSP27]|uniref:serine hydrolase domain-containing protein n=1 Tax=unclassified Flavobacterium TaxID=196869 RepID=UPI000F842723|nr:MULTISPECIES: serine hydrolase domain-containing protein [unclassified Flavobacterium]RTY94406.1 class A beta-lactamase-related serine hydrolase [Flavobacterium sp. GSN2]RTY70576.1 class A beta-lactamase-related serine hydrolase [Flavobacterium sp. LB2P53]RTY79585.1 class A beta-lactamase-related serine hydrolase [Flavobacterium sp. LS1P28]RTY89892.1 class A beta-lactamase-related serine hydrolase [Flavobacterium sp. RSP46]RTZ04288.1 class A beta-lactamase-related serine hydrolase [Flavobac
MKKTLLLIALLTVFNNTYSQEDKVDLAIKELIQKNKIVGLQLSVIKENVIVKTSHYGFANIQDSIAVNSQTVFSINSITKAFTGVAIMQLVENGKLNLEEPISNYLDKLPQTWQKITVEQLATHKSGLPDVWDSQGNMLSEDGNILFENVKKLPLAFEPGKHVREGLANYMLLGMLIEKISGQSFEKFIMENQFKKAGMKNAMKAGIGDFYNIINNSSRPYTYFRNNVLTNVYQPMPSNLLPAGGIYATATEMAQWVIALQTNQLINAENLKILLKPIELENGKPYEENGLLDRTSIGFSLSSRAENPIIASMGGARNALFIYPNKNVSIVILTNLMGSHPQAFIEEIAKLYIN